MFKLIVVSALVVGLVAGAPTDYDRQTQLEIVIFYTGKPVEPSVMLATVDELHEIYKHVEPKGSELDYFNRKWTEVLHKIGHPSEENCADASYIQEFYRLREHSSHMKDSTAAFVDQFAAEQDQICKDKVNSEVHQYDRQTQLEISIFYTGKQVEPREMLSMVDELNEIYKQVEPKGTAMDDFNRKCTAVLHKIGHPTKSHCADLSYFQEFAKVRENSSYLKDSTTQFFNLYKQQQEQMC